MGVVVNVVVVTMVDAVVGVARHGAALPTDQIGLQWPSVQAKGAT